MGNFIWASCLLYPLAQKGSWKKWLMSRSGVCHHHSLILPTNDNDNNNNNILFDHNIQIDITIFNSLENQIINWSGDYY